MYNPLSHGVGSGLPQLRSYLLDLSDQRLKMQHLSDPLGRLYPLDPRLLSDLSGRSLDLSDQPHLEDQWHLVHRPLLGLSDLRSLLDLSVHSPDLSDLRYPLDQRHPLDQWGLNRKDQSNL